jgi:hypothetical protein
MAGRMGLVLRGSHRLEDLLRPLHPYPTRCHWIIDDQTGPFDSVWIYGSPENEALIARQQDVAECRDTTTSCWRPRTLPKLSAHVVVDEWTYFFAIDAPEDEVRRRAGHLSRRIGDLSEEFFSRLDVLADLFMFHADGWWEFYATCPDWHGRLQSGLAGCVLRTARRAGEPPG